MFLKYQNIACGSENGGGTTAENWDGVEWGVVISIFTSEV